MFHMRPSLCLLRGHLKNSELKPDIFNVILSPTKLPRPGVGDAPRVSVASACAGSLRCSLSCLLLRAGAVQAHSCLRDPSALAPLSASLRIQRSLCCSCTTLGVPVQAWYFLHTPSILQELCWDSWGSAGCGSLMPPLPRGLFELRSTPSALGFQSP